MKKIQFGNYETFKIPKKLQTAYKRFYKKFNYERSLVLMVLKVTNKHVKVLESKKYFVPEESFGWKITVEYK